MIIELHHYIAGTSVWVNTDRIHVLVPIPDNGDEPGSYVLLGPKDDDEWKVRETVETILTLIQTT